MSKESSSKSLKDANRPKLWMTIAANLVVLYGFSQYEAVTTSGIKGLIAGATSLVPLTLSLIVTTIANGFLSDKTKTRLVFMRWRHALRGIAPSASLPSPIRASTWMVCGSSSARIGRPTRKRESDVVPPLQGGRERSGSPLRHGEYLFTRDYAGFAALFVFALGTAAGFTVRPIPVLLVYLGCLLLQFLVVRHTAATYGERFVCTVLARKAASRSRKPPSPPSVRRRPRVHPEPIRERASRIGGRLSSTSG